MAVAQIIEIPLRRQDNTQPWGFRLKGGTDQGIPLQIESAPLTGRAARAGLKAGDYVLAINGVPVGNFTHEQVKSEILRAGNEIDIIVQRGSPPRPGDEFIPAMGGEPVQETPAPAPAPTKAPAPAPATVQAPAPAPTSVQGPAPSSVFSATRGGQVGPDEPRAQVCAEPTVKIGGPTYKQVQPKTYKVLEDQLPASEAGMGDRPASIFDRKKQERSDYLKAKGPTIQKAYGES